MTRYVTHDGYRAGLGARVAKFLLADDLVALLKYLLEETYSEDYKCTALCDTYAVDADARTVKIYDVIDTGKTEFKYGMELAVTENVERTMSYEEFSAWCDTYWDN